MKKTLLYLSTFLLALGGAAPVRAADTSKEVEMLRQQVQDLLKRIDTLEHKTASGSQGPSSNKPMVTSGNNNVSLQISGQVNRAVVAVHDGDRSRVKHVDGAMSPTRFNFHAKAKLNETTKVGSVWEVGINENSSDSVATGKEFSSVNSNNINNRKVYIYGESTT